MAELVNVTMGLATVGLWAESRDVLLNAADNLVRVSTNTEMVGRIELGREPIGPTTAPYLRIVLVCGNVREWARENVPDRDIECHCGDLDYAHWFIKYGRADG